VWLKKSAALSRTQKHRTLWLGHEQISTTNIYLHADMTHKQQAIDRTKPLNAKPGRYQPTDTLLAFLQAL
jgi:site-specific recombinase XerC